MAELIQATRELMVFGGSVMPPLVGIAALLWYALGLRFLRLRRGDRRPLRALVAARAAGENGRAHGIVDGAVAAVVERVHDRPAHDRQGLPGPVLEELLARPRARLAWGRDLVRTLVMVAPLAGLLGTVTGMIETFRSLADMALFTQGGGIAGGISQALLTTQLGLSIAVPGILVGRALDRKEARLGAELLALEELLRSTPLQVVRP